MASIYREITLEAEPEHVWAAIRDVGAVHKRLAPGFVVDVRLEGDVRIVTFADGRVIRERIVGIDDERRRLAYAAEGVAERSHHNACFQVFAAGEKMSRIVWITDVLPDEAAAPIARNMEKGLAVVKRQLEQGERE
jgi:carbon monoxide dehydrogenase subunit G